MNADFTKMSDAMWFLINNIGKAISRTIIETNLDRLHEVVFAERDFLNFFPTDPALDNWPTFLNGEGQC